MKAQTLVSWSLTPFKNGILTFQLLLIMGAGQIEYFKIFPYPTRNIVMSIEYPEGLLEKKSLQSLGIFRDKKDTYG